MSVAPSAFTGERIVPSDCRTQDDYLMYLRHVAAYEAAARLLAGADSTIEVGSGEGYGAALLAAKGLDVTGLEIDPVSVVRAQRGHGGGGCRFVRFDGRALPFGDGHFDSGLSLQVIEHVEWDRPFVAELARVVTAGGVVVITTPNAALRLRPGQRPWNRYHVREYRAEELAELLQSGFREVLVHGLTASPEVLQLERQRLRRIRRIDRLDPLRLRTVLPTVVERSLRALLRRLVAAGGAHDGTQGWQERFTAGDFQVTENLSEALDLLAICRR